MSNKISASCCPSEAKVAAGQSIPIVVALINKSDREVELLASGVPWIFHHAISFHMVEGPSGVTLENRLWMIDPPTVPDTLIGPGETANGIVDLAAYLFDADGRCINELPGSYRIGARIVALASYKGEEDFNRLELDCDPFNLTIKA
jgi:hypothetical protein